MRIWMPSPLIPIGAEAGMIIVVLSGLYINRISTKVGVVLSNECCALEDIGVRFDQNFKC